MQSSTEEKSVNSVGTRWPDMDDIAIGEDSAIFECLDDKPDYVTDEQLKKPHPLVQ